MMPDFLRAYCVRVEGAELAAGPIRFVASTEGVKRDGKSLRADRWRLDNFRRNPVVLWTHDYMGRTLPIGRAEVGTEGPALVAEVVFDGEDEFARQVESKYRRGFLNAVSVGWDEVRQGSDTWYELLDVSAVPVPGDPDALIEREYRALGEILGDGQGRLRRAIPPHTSEKAEEDLAWDGPGEVSLAEEDVGALRRMHAWCDGEVYQFAHHLAGGEVVWRGVAAAMADLFHVGAEFPEGERRGVWNHLERHYRQFEKEAPEFRTAVELGALGPEEIRGLFLEGEEEGGQDLQDLQDSLRSQAGRVVHPGMLAPTQGRLGAVLNGRNRERLEQAMGLIGEVLASAGKGGAVGDRPQQDEEEDETERALARIHEMLKGWS